LRQSHPIFLSLFPNISTHFAQKQQKPKKKKKKKII